MFQNYSETFICQKPDCDDKVVVLCMEVTVQADANSNCKCLQKCMSNDIRDE